VSSGAFSSVANGNHIVNADHATFTNVTLNGKAI
jgi:hypothetical protein